MLSKEEHLKLLEKTYSIKKRFLKMYYSANAGHVGSSLSCAEILAYVRFSWMRDEDELILSKGHAAAALYSLLAEAGMLSESDISTFYKNETYLAAHPPAGKIRGIPFGTGSLGHGLSLATGLGLAARLKSTQKRAFCITSDGELNEGSLWEAALFIAHHKLDNVIWIVDRNMLQGFGRTEDILQLEPLKEKISAFGFSVISVNGHDFNELDSCKNFGCNGKPLCVIANTIKGRGWEGMEDQLDCHYLPMTDEMYNKINENLEVEFKKLRQKTASL